MIIQSKSIKPNLFSGDIYFVESLNLSSTFDFKKEFDKVVYITENWKIEHGNIIDNVENEKLKFDIIPTSDFYGCFFSGFLYSDGKVLGKVKHVHEANEADIKIYGQYKKVNKNKFLLCCTWEYLNGSKEYFWAELIRN